MAGFYGIFMRLLHCFQKHSSQLCPLLGPSAALIIKAASACFYCSMPSLLRSLEQSYPDQDWFDVAGFQRNGTVQVFGTKGQKFLHCLGTKGQGKLKILTRAGTGQPVKIRDGMRDGMGW